MMDALRLAVHFRPSFIVDAPLAFDYKSIQANVGGLANMPDHTSPWRKTKPASGV